MTLRDSNGLWEMLLLLWKREVLGELDVDGTMGGEGVFYLRIEQERRTPLMILVSEMAP